MIFNPIMVKGGREPKWQELELKADGARDVPIMRAPPISVSLRFELQFDSLPTAIIFRTLFDGFEWSYSVVGLYNGSYQVFNSQTVGVDEIAVSGTTISGWFSSADVEADAQFLPIYN